MSTKLTRRQRLYLPLKRFIDIFGSLLGIILLSPLLLLAAIVTKCTSKGPVIFKQKRAGKRLKPFNLYKFRSMRIDAPSEMPPEDMSIKDQSSLVTKWGAFMRKCSIDELPQLFNILAGDVSFIGPRPCLAGGHEDELIKARLSYLPNAYDVKPGLSGYAQIHMKRDHEIHEKAKLDAYYARNFGFWMDVKLFMMSLLVPFGFVKGR